VGHLIFFAFFGGWRSFYGNPCSTILFLDASQLLIRRGIDARGIMGQKRGDARIMAGGKAITGRELSIY